MIAASALFGIVDLGTWNIRFSINSIQPHHARILPGVFQDRAPIRLYKGPDVAITPAEIAETLIVLKRFVEICASYGVPPKNVRIAANPHEAPNFDDLVAKIHEELQLDVLRLSREGEHWASAYCIAASVYQARGIYIELRPSHANLYYLNLSNIPADPRAELENSEKTPPEALIGPVRVPYLPNSRYKVHSPPETGDSASPLPELADFRRQLADACATLAEKAQMSRTESRTVFLSSSGFFGLHTLLASASSGPQWVTNGLVLVPSALRKLAPSSSLAHVVQIVGASLPPNTQRIVYVHHNLRNGLLFQALPPSIRHQDPLLVATAPYALPGAPQLAEELRCALPEQLCPLFVRERLARCVANAAYVHSSYSLEVQSGAALAVAQTGILAGTNGATHEEKALIDIALCQRWGGFLNEAASAMYSDLVSAVVEPSLVSWATYCGLVLYLLGAAFPGAHVRPNSVKLRTLVSEEVGAEVGAEARAEAGMEARAEAGMEAGMEARAEACKFRLIVSLKQNSLFGDNVIMDARIKRVRAKLASLKGVDVEMDVEKV